MHPSGPIREPVCKLHACGHADARVQCVAQQKPKAPANATVNPHAIATAHGQPRKANTTVHAQPGKRKQRQKQLQTHKQTRKQSEGKSDCCSRSSGQGKGRRKRLAKQHQKPKYSKRPTCNTSVGAPSEPSTSASVAGGAVKVEPKCIAIRTECTAAGGNAVKVEHECIANRPEYAAAGSARSRSGTSASPSGPSARRRRRPGRGG